MRRILLIVASSALVLAATAPTASAVRETLTLAPSESTGLARQGIAVGPFGLQNFTQLTYDVTVLPTFLQQDREGRITVDQRESGLARAKSFLTGREES